MFKVKKKKKGLTLIETLVSLVILSFIITPILMIVSSSRNINRDGQNSQTGIYILQKYMEQFKQKDVSSTNLKDKEFFEEETFTEGSKSKTRLFKVVTPNASETNKKDKDIQKGYKVKVSIEPLMEYQFSDATSVATGTPTGAGGNATNSSNNGYSSIPYDVKLKIVKDSKTGVAAHLEVYKKADDKNYIGILDLKKDYSLEISNGEGNDSSIAISVKDSAGKDISSSSSWTISKSVTTNNASIIVQVDSNEERASDINLSINCYNNIKDSNMNLYLARSREISASGSNDVINCFKDQQGNSLVNIKQGTVYVTEGIYDRTDSSNPDNPDDYSNKTRLYKIIVSLYKENQDHTTDQPIQQITGYKTVNK